jgi:GT2 family glycosyltransferase
VRSAKPLLDVVVVVSGNDREHLETCLESLSRSPLTLGHTVVHVVDNATRDGTAEMVKSRFANARLHELGRNAGFCVANNVGLRAGSAPYALVLSSRA